MSYSPITRIGVIGCGAIAELYHLPTLAAFVPARVQLSLADTNAARLHQLQHAFKAATVVTDYRELAGAVDGVIIATPPLTHFQIATYFLERGVHVLCEKPLTESLAEANELIATARTHGVTLSVNHTRRLFPNLSEIHHRLAAGALGDILSITYHEGCEFNWPAASAFHFAPSAKGVLSDTGIHLLDTICWWLNATPDLIASENDSYGGPEAVAVVRLRHGRCHVEIKVSRLTRLANQFQIRGTKGTIEGSTDSWRDFSIQSGSRPKRVVRLSAAETSYGDFAKPLLANFLDVITRGGEPLISGETALPGIELLEQAYQQVRRFELPWNSALELSHVG
jgi:predicted dehydrogenase